MKNGKIFGRINIIDLLVIIAVVVAIVGALVRVSTFSKNNVGDKVSFEYVVRVNDVREYTVKGLEKGGQIYSEKENKLLGEIVSVSSETAKVENVMQDGERKFVERPDRFAAFVTIRAEGACQNGIYYDASETPIGVGSEYKICSKYVSTSGDIVDFRIPN